MRTARSGFASRFRQCLANLRRRRRHGQLRDEAAHALSQARRLQPSLSIEWVEKYFQIVNARDRAVYIQGLRAAGLK